MTDQPAPHDALHPIIAHHIGEIRSLTSLGQGMDNVAFLVNGDLVVRQAKTPDTEAIRREVELLRVVGEYSPLPVPQVVFSDPEAGVLAYRALQGLPALTLQDAQLHLDPEPLGSFLTAIHAIPVADVESLVARDDEPLTDWLDEANESYVTIAKVIPARLRSRIEAFLTEPPPPAPDRVAFCHNDLGAEHILIDRTTLQITGIIDWTDAAITDPVRDLALILRDFGPHMLQRVLAAYGTTLTPEDHHRLVFHARCKLIEDIAFGMESGSSRYLDAALAHVDWTFGPSAR